MDYTGQDCKNMFTSCQKTRMRASLESGARLPLLTSSGLALEPPTSDFTAPSPTCAGNIQFTDTSTDVPDSWAWSFPGGTPSSLNDRNPMINYNSGTYDISLTASNAIGTGTTETKTDYLIVFDPPPSVCPATTTNTSNSLNMGITNVTLGTINFTSDNSVTEGYQDLTCFQVTTLTPGQDYSISITTGTPNDEDVRVYIDYDNDGIFRLQDELAFSSDDTGPTHTGTVSIPGGVITDSLVRMRVISDSHFNTTSACSNPEYGQAEDYGVIFQAANAPVSDFSTEANPACTGSIQYYNHSTNGSSSWNWSFPGGTPSTSTAINPQVTYNTPAIYSASLTANNEVGAGTTETKNDYLGVYSIQNATCSPTTVNLGNGGYHSGIHNITFNTINNSSGAAYDDDQTFGGLGYLDFSCDQTTVLSPSSSYSVFVTVGSTNAEQVYIYIDYNNDGDFNDAGELAGFSPSAIDTHDAIPIITPTEPVKNKMLRMRVMTSLNSLTNACDQPDIGQVEDYGVVFQDNFATIDISQPSSTIAGPNSVTYTVTYSDAAAITLSANDVSLQTPDDADGTISVSGDTGSTRAVTISNMSGNGTLAIVISTGTATDAAGNPAIGKTSSSFTVDTTLPVVSITSPVDGLKTSNMTHVLDYTVTETNQGTTTVTVNGNPISYTSGTELTLEEGTSVIVVSHTDAAGNGGNATITIDANRGDINHDGAVNITDVILALKLLATSIDTNNEIVYAEADLNGDQKIGLHEVVFILRKLAGI